MLPYKHSKPGRPTQEKGVVLILVLGILSILVVIALEYTLSMRLELKIAQKFLYTKDATFAADTGIQEMIRVIREKYRLDSNSWYDGTYPFRSRAYTFLDEAWAIGVQHTDTDDTGMQYDTRYGTTQGIGLSSNFQEDTSDGHFIQGVQDEQGKVNLNTVEAEMIIWLNLYLGNTADADLGFDLEMHDVQDTYETINEVFAKSPTHMTGRLFYGEDYGDATRGDTNDHSITNKDTVAVDGILYTGMEDFITVSSEVTTDSGVGIAGAASFQQDTFDGIPYAIAPVNINTTSWIVLKGLFHSCLNSEAHGIIFANAIINYRTGGDGVHGDGDDDPFDGFYSHTNTSVYQAPFTAVAAFNGDGIDNNGNGFLDWSDTQLYAGGARGEFEAFLDEVANVEATVTQNHVNIYKNYFSIIHIRDFDGPTFGIPDGKIKHSDTWATSYDSRSEASPFCFSSNTYSITSVGKKRRPSGETGAIVKRRWIIQMDQQP